MRFRMLVWLIIWMPFIISFEAIVSMLIIDGFSWGSIISGELLLIVSAIYTALIIKNKSRLFRSSALEAAAEATALDARSQAVVNAVTQLNERLSQVLPIWSRQIEYSRNLLDTSIGELSGEFVQMAERLRDVIQIADDELTHDQHASGTDAVRLFDQAHDELNVVFKELMQALLEESDTFSALEALSNESETLLNMSKSVTQVADQINLLALNAAIEAARADEHGGELSVQAIFRYLKHVISNLRYESMELHQVSADINKNIQHVISSFQFQDRVSQTMSHVVQEIEQVQTEIDRYVNDSSQGNPLPIAVNALLAEFKSHSTSVQETAIYEGKLAFNSKSTEDEVDAILF